MNMWPFDRKHREWTKAVVEGLKHNGISTHAVPVAEKYKSHADWAVKQGLLEYLPGLNDRFVRLPVS